MRLGETIKGRRQALKLSQEYVAERLGVSRQAVSKWETGQSEPTAENLVALASVLEISLSDLAFPQGKGANQAGENGMRSRWETKPVLRTNLSMLAIAFQAGMLYSCTQVPDTVAGGHKTPDHGFMLIKLGLLLLCSLWMVANLLQEKDRAQRRKNSRIELLYCCIQAGAALCTFRFQLGLLGLLMMAGISLVYILYINPKYMNRPFGKRGLHGKV